MLPLPALILTVVFTVLGFYAGMKWDLESKSTIERRAYARGLQQGSLDERERRRRLRLARDFHGMG